MTSTIDLEPAIVTAIRSAYTDAHENECRRAAAWVENVGWRFAVEQFEDELENYGRLDEKDRAELWQFRGRLLKERGAE